MGKVIWARLYSLGYKFSILYVCMYNEIGFFITMGFQAYLTYLAIFGAYLTYWHGYCKVIFRGFRVSTITLVITLI